ncbi:MAG: PAS domain S-box protein, partial [Microcoleaceae cyanobacterium]
GWCEAIHPDDRQRVRQLWQTIINTNSRFSAEYRLLNPTGKKRWVLGQATADRDKTGQVTGYVGTITDISDRKGIEETIRQIAEGVSAQTGDAFFQSLVEYLATLLEVDIALVSEIENYPGGRKARTVAIWKDGKIHTNIEYDLTNTPCQQVVIDEKLCHFGENVQAVFPDDHLLSMMEAEAYIGTPLLRCAGEPLGLIAVISRKPLLQTTFCDEIMRIFAVRATVELERRDALIALQQLNQELEARVEQRTIALKESQAQLQELFDNANDLIQSVSLVDGHFIYVNRAWQETLGYTETEISQISLSDIVPADDWYLFENIFQQLQSPHSGVLDRQEVRFLTKKKKLVILEGNLNCRYENDRPTMIRGIFRDITAQKQVQNVIQESEAKYRAMMNDASDGIMLIDQNYQVIEVNRKTEDLFGYTALEFSKMSLSHWVLFPPTLQAKAEDLWQLLWRNKSIVWNNTSLLHKQGH